MLLNAYLSLRRVVRILFLSHATILSSLKCTLVAVRKKIWLEKLNRHQLFDGSLEILACFRKVNRLRTFLIFIVFFFEREFFAEFIDL
jgi:hypothetical protein